MLIRKNPVKNVARTAAKLPTGSLVPTGMHRLESLLAALERNVDLEAYFLSRKEIGDLLELLPVQSDLLKSLVDLAETLELTSSEAEELNRRLGSVDEKRAKNRLQLDELILSARSELEDLNAARRKLQQMKTLSKNFYADPEPSQLEDWA
jgi:hypothetical protein